MTQGFNVYCDESCHLEHDRQKVMVLGAIWCPFEKARETAQAIRAIKAKHGLGRDFEVRWTKVSPGDIASYIEQINRCCPQKSGLSPPFAGG